MRWSPGRLLVRYILATYLAFWLLLGCTGVLIALKLPSIVVAIMQNACAWAPTFVLLLQFKRLHPGTTPRDYLKASFAAKAGPLVYVSLLIVQAAVVACAVGAHSLLAGDPKAALPLANLSTLPAALLVTVTSGPTGEELGWRGFVLPELEKRFTPFASSLILGLIWGFWHLPLWLISGYGGGRLLAYIVFFMIGIVSLSVLITFSYDRQRNILVAMWIHFLFNFLLRFVALDLVVLLAYTSVGYFVVAVVLVICGRKSLFVLPKAAMS